MYKVKDRCRRRLERWGDRMMMIVLSQVTASLHQVVVVIIIVTRAVRFSRIDDDWQLMEL